MASVEILPALPDSPVATMTSPVIASTMASPVTAPAAVVVEEEEEEDLLTFMRRALGFTSGPPQKPTTTGVQSSAEYIYNNAIDVALDMRGCKAAAEYIYQGLKTTNYTTQWATNSLHASSMDERQVEFIFLLDLLNFSFWSDKGKEERYRVDYKGEEYTGYMSLLAVMNRALDEDIPLLDPNAWVDEEILSDSVLEHMFRSETEEPMPMVKERISVLREAGRILIDKFDGSFVNCITEANNSAVDLVNLLTSTFPCFNDSTTFKGRQVKFYKRAQILVADLWASFDNTSYGHFTDITSLTMFADYRVPVILHYFGCLTYSPILEHALKTEKNMESGERWEVEIRGCTVQCVELIRREILRAHPEEEHVGGVNAVVIDFFLYDEAKKLEDEEKEMIVPHRTRSIWY